MGYTSSKGAGSKDGWILKVDSLGVEEWDNAYGLGNPDVFSDIAIASDGGYLVCGSSYVPNNAWGMWIMKTDASGSALSEQLFGGSQQDEAHSIVPALEGGYVVAGHTYSEGSGNSDVWVIKTDVGKGSNCE